MTEQITVVDEHGFVISVRFPKFETSEKDNKKREELKHASRK